MALTERQRAVLSALIDRYIESAEPVSSRMLARTTTLNVSSATIRNTMSELEDLGYLDQPHTSAGRIPTDRAYRLYVEELVHLKDVATATQAQIRETIDIATSVEDVLDRASQVLSLICEQLGIALSPHFDDGIFNALELIRLAEHHLLVVLTLKSGLVRTISMELRLDLPPSILAQTSRLLNERLHGLTLREIRHSINDRLRDKVRPDFPLLVQIVQNADHVFQMEHEVRIFVGDPTRLINKPEFMDRDHIADLFCLMNRRHQLAGLLNTTPPEMNDWHISIGTEHQTEAMSNYSVVSSAYRIGSTYGTVGIIGPKRMPYARLIPMVQFTASIIDEMLATY